MLFAVPFAMKMSDTLTVFVAALFGAGVSYPFLESFVWK